MKKIEEEIQETFIKNNWTLSIAESCTGGAISATLAKQPGASTYFLGSLVCYSNRFKEKFLNVSAKTLFSKGSVSEETVVAMASGILSITEADFIIAITGIAGPSGGTKKTPVGTVWIAVCKRGEKPEAHCLCIDGSRQMIIKRSVEAALVKLLSYTKFILKNK